MVSRIYLLYIDKLLGYFGRIVVFGINCYVFFVYLYGLEGFGFLIIYT